MRLENLPARGTTWAYRYGVCSDSGNDYVVSCDGARDKWACGCRGWTMHTPRRDCKHITFVKIFHGQPDRTPTPTIDRNIPRSEIRLPIERAHARAVEAIAQENRARWNAQAQEEEIARLGLTPSPKKSDHFIGRTRRSIRFED